MSLRTSLYLALERNAINQLKWCFEEDQCYLNADFNLDDLQYRLGLSEERVISLLHTGYGLSFHEVCSRCRLKHLKGLVLNHGNEISVAEYAERSGFKNVPQMQSALEDCFGMDFEEFKKHIKKLQH